MLGLPVSWKVADLSLSVPENSAVSLSKRASVETLAIAFPTGDLEFLTDGFRPIKVLVYEPKVEYEVKLKDFMAWLDRNSRSPRETINRMKIREILGVKKLS